MEPSNLARWAWDIVHNHDPVAAHDRPIPSIRFTLFVRCHSCGEIHEQRSPLWALIQRRGEQRFDLADDRLTYHMVLDAGKSTHRSIEWITRCNVGMMTYRLTESSWKCANCGQHFGLNQAGESKFKQEVCRTVTIETVEARILDMMAYLDASDEEPYSQLQRQHVPT